MKSAKEDLNKKRRDAETLVFDFKNRIEQEEILEKNISNDISHIEDKIKKERLTLKELEKRLVLIESNSILNSISALFTSGSHKADEIRNSISFSVKQIEIYERALFSKKDELNSISKIDKVPLATKEKELRENIQFSLNENEYKKGTNRVQMRYTTGTQIFADFVPMGFRY
jgi:hypothetical protein